LSFEAAAKTSPFLLNYKSLIALEPQRLYLGVVSSQSDLMTTFPFDVPAAVKNPYSNGKFVNAVTFEPIAHTSIIV
jgi:hypothetical protein